MVKKIVYTQNGKVKVDSLDPRQPDQLYVDRMVSRGFTDAVVLDSSTFPDEQYIEAWELSGTTININMVLAKQILVEKLRREREEHFRKLDKLYIEASSSKRNLDNIKSRQQYLRDITENPAIESATTVEDLNSIVIQSWETPAVKVLNNDVVIHNIEDDVESSTTGKNFKTKTRMNFNSETAKYLITFSAEVKNANKQGNCKVRILLDGSEINRTSRKSDPFENDYNIVSGSCIKNLTEGNHYIDVEYATNKGACYIRRVRLQAMKVEK